MDGNLTERIRRLPDKVKRVYRRYYALVLNDTRVKAMIESGTYDEALLAQVCDVYLDDISGGLSSLMRRTIMQAIAEGTSQARVKVRSALGNDGGRDFATMSAARQAALYSNLAERRVGGVTLSERVWNLSEASRKDLGVIVDNAITEGLSAAETAAEAKRCLNEPYRLFRRVRDKETGELRLSKAAQQYHPGRGVYRSSTQNAVRMARTETQTAYHAAEVDSYTSSPLVKGYEVRLSNNHTTKLPNGKVVPLYDICDELQGVYPKWFQFTVWHPNCRCTVIPIVLNDSELKDYFKAKREGTLDAFSAAHDIKDVPASFRVWAANNTDRILAASERGKLPSFLSANGKIVDGKLVLNMPGGNPADIAKQRHDARTPEQIKDIQERWQKRKEAYDALDSLRAEYGEIKSFDSKKFSDLYGQYDKMSKAVREYRNTLDAAFNELSLLVNAKQYAKEFTLSELRRVQDAVGAKLTQLQGLSMQKQKTKLEQEIKYVEDPTYLKQHSIYPTWKVAQDAYKKQLSVVEENIAYEHIDTVKAWSESHKGAKVIAKIVEEVETLKANGAPIADVKAKLSDIDKRIDIYEKAEQTRQMKKGKGAVLFPEDAFSKERKDAAVWDKGSGSKAASVLIEDAKRCWNTASERERDMVYKYTESYCDVNEPLNLMRYYNPQTKSHFKDKVNAVTNYIERSSLETDMWFQRGFNSFDTVLENMLRMAGDNSLTSISIRSNPQLLVGKTIKQGGFMSAGSNKGKGFDTRQVIFNIYAPKGTKAVYVEPFSHYGEGAKRSWDGVREFHVFSKENETLFQRGTIMRVTKVEYIGGKYYIDVEVIGYELNDLSYVPDDYIGR